MLEIPEIQSPKPEADRRDSECIGQKRSATENTGMKVEPDFVTFAPLEELQFLRARVQELEREKEAMAEENRRLKDMLVNEIPSLLSSMRWTLSTCTTRGSDSDFAKTQCIADSPEFPTGATENTDFIRAAPACLREPEPRPEFLQAIPHSAPRRLDGSQFAQTMAPSAERDDHAGGEYVVSNEHGSAVCPRVVTDEDCHTRLSSACSSPALPQPRDCGEMAHRRIVAGNKRQRVIGNGNDHVRQVEVYPGSSVFCEARVWHAAVQAPSPTAMARTLLLGVFDMDTLLHSNLRGGRSRRPTFPNHRAGLDPHKLDAIYSTDYFLSSSLHICALPLAQSSVSHALNPPRHPTFCTNIHSQLLAQSSVSHARNPPVTLPSALICTLSYWLNHLSVMHLTLPSTQLFTLSD
ncbi:hypothetical protein GJAV_G00242100 [Gymnothorax javanicus]|nr:hypothetical protein GJAV_G00242100 [Gymnothorax javanicus]